MRSRLISCYDARQLVLRHLGRNLAAIAIMPSVVPVRLSELRVGSRARFHEARLDPASAGLLRALGVTGDCKLRLCKNGEPCIVQVRSTRIGLSKSVAGGIFVIPEADTAA